MDRESFLARSSKTATCEVALDDGQTVLIRKLTQHEVETIRKRYASEDKALEGFRYIVSRCVVDESGKRVFEDADMEKLATVDFQSIQKIATEVSTFSGLHVPKNT